MPAARQDIIIEQNASFTLPLTLLTQTSEVNPTLIPMDLTNFTAESQIRDTYDNPNFLTNFTIAFAPSGSTTGSFSSSGSLTLSLTPQQTLALPFGRWVWDLFLFQGSISTKILYGEAWVRPAVSR